VDIGDGDHKRAVEWRPMTGSGGMADGNGLLFRRGAVRHVPERIEERLIVALDVPTIPEARELVAKLDGLVSFFKIGLWLQFASGVDSLIDDLLEKGKKVFLDSKMFDIGETVKQGVIRAASRGVTFVTVHGDSDIIKAAVAGKGDSDLKVFTITVLTSLDNDSLREMGYLVGVDKLIEVRVRQSIEFGADGIIASAMDNPNKIRELAGAQSLLIATPGIRLPGASVDDHKRSATPYEAIRDGADYLVVGRPIIKGDDPAKQARIIIEDMRRGLAGS
jgi:orotidine-5'-phosphate decarboxylase